MFLVTKPDTGFIEQFIAAQADSALSYIDVGCTNSAPPIGYNLDHNRVKLGAGKVTMHAAIEALSAWRMFTMSWLELCRLSEGIEKDMNVAVLINHFGFWSLNANRIVYTFHNDSGDVEKFGFAYGTLLQHGEMGEEKFTVEFHKKTGEVWYEILAMSRPRHILAKLGYPLTRHLQKRFAVDSMNAMIKATTK